MLMVKPIRQLRSKLAWVMGLILSGLVIYTAATGPFDDIYQRSLAVGISAALLLLSDPLGANRTLSKSTKALAGLIDILLLAAILLATTWFFIVHDELETGLYDLQADDMAVAVGGLVVLIELTRRTMGMPLAVLALLSAGYCLLGSKLPWILAHAGYGLEETLRTLWYSFDGVFSMPVAVVTNLIVIFVVFGVVLEGTGAGAVLLRIAFSLTGRLRGGPAHASVVASGLFGTISGSPVGNVVGTGVFTMPMIIRCGFPKAFAGAVEAAASSGGQFMPPVMGAVAFIMADLTGTPYLTICIAALLPAVFFYGSLFASVSLEAVRLGIEPLPKEQRAILSLRDWLQSLMFALPIAVILSVLISGRSPAMAGFLAIVSAVAMGWLLNPEFRKDPKILVKTLAKAGRTASMLLAVVATIGIVVGTINLTGLGLRFSMLILSFSDDTMFVSLVLMMLGSLILGMGLPTVPAYLIIVLIIGPAIQKLGVEPLLIHLFVMYFGVLSNITPPVALAAFAAATICEANPIKVAMTAVRIALIGFLIPYVVIYNPTLTLVFNFDIIDFVWICIRLSLAIWLVGTGFAGVEMTSLSNTMRLARLACGFMVLWQDTWIQISTVILGLLIILQNRMQMRRKITN